MINNKKEYFIKLGEDFFKREEIIKMKETNNWHSKVCIYLNMLENTIKTRGRIDLINGAYTISDLIKNMEEWVDIKYKDIEETIKVLESLNIISIYDNKYIQINNYEEMLDYNFVETKE